MHSYTEDQIMAAESAISGLLAAFNIDEGDHTDNTPHRVAKAWADVLGGYTENPADHLATTFTAPQNPGLVVVRNIRMQSTCAHHLLPITGTATVAYRPRPGERVVGLSKINRLVDGYARRLQVQENITAQVVDAIADRLNPLWVACAITADYG
ncbi:GTP cyclohydrolase I, partial [Cutibacterium acnes]